MKPLVAVLIAFVLISCASSGQTDRINADDTPPSVQPQAANQASGSEAPNLHDTLTQRIPGTDVTFRMTYIPGGSFVVGSPAAEPSREDDEGPQRTVEVSPFWMMIHEVTHDQFDVFRFREQDNDSTLVAGTTFDPDAAVRPSPPYEDPAVGMGKDGHPAVGMTNWAALQYARWLYEKTGEFYRLPTEIEWEYACRAGSTDAYSFGDDPDALDTYAWYWDNSGEEYHPVGEKEPNAWGLYDMHGNVAEWTLDEYRGDYYSSLENGELDPWSQPTALHPRTVRGGAYDDDPEALRCAGRLESSLSWKRRDPQLPKSFWWNTDSPFVGFRLVKPANEITPEEAEEFFLLTLGE